MNTLAAVDREPDIVLEILQRVRVAVPALSDDQVRVIEESIRHDFGGMRLRVAKRKKHPSPEKRREIFAQALTDKPTEEITSGNGIHRSTLYRLLKRGGT